MAQTPKDPLEGLDDIPVSADEASRFAAIHNASLGMLMAYLKITKKIMPELFDSANEGAALAYLSGVIDALMEQTGNMEPPLDQLAAALKEAGKDAAKSSIQEGTWH